jgi:nucleoside-diphosphate-sugar epimerase
MSVLVTGATGFLGPAVVARLLARGEVGVAALARPGSPLERLQRLATAHGSSWRVLTGRLDSVEAARRVLAESEPEVVYHVAAGLKGSPADLFLNTVVASKNLLEAAATRPSRPRFVLVSSFSVYGVADRPRGSLVDEATPFEPHPQRRDSYAQAKLRQERLFEEYRVEHRLETVVARPGVIYGAGGPPLSSRVGLPVAGVFLALGGANVLPLSYVESCADALALLGRDERAVNGVFNVHDDDLPTARQFLRRYRREVGGMRVIPVPYPMALLLAGLIERYHRASRGQLPAILTPYKVASTWKGNVFTNARLKSLGWRPLVPTEEGLDRHFAALRESMAGRSPAQSDDAPRRAL